MKNSAITLCILAAVLCGCATTAVDHQVLCTQSSEPISATTESSELTDDSEETASLITDATTTPYNIELPHGSYCDKYSSIRLGASMDYWLHVPENATTEMPLIVFLHGVGEVDRIDLLENYGIIQKAREYYGEEFPFIVLTPCTQMKSWTRNNNPELLKELIDYIVTSYEIDREKIILTGHSLGSIGTWYMLSQYGDYFSAGVPVSCGCDEILMIENIAKVPIQAYVGDADAYEPKYENGMRRILQNVLDAGGRAELIVLTGMTHEDTITGAYDLELFEWMISQ